MKDVRRSDELRAGESGEILSRKNPMRLKSYAVPSKNWTTDEPDELDPDDLKGYYDV